MDLLAENSIAADLATATASPPTWMSHLYPSMLPVMREGIRLSHGSRQHYCPNSSDFRRKSAALVERLTERYHAHPALKMLHLNNEYGCHTDQCYCDTCAEAFRGWLRASPASVLVPRPDGDVADIPLITQRGLNRHEKKASNESWRREMELQVCSAVSKPGSSGNASSIT